MVHVKGLGVSTRFSHCRIHGALYLEPMHYMYRYVTVHVTELLHMLHQQVPLRYTKPSSPQKRTNTPLFRPPNHGSTATRSIHPPGLHPASRKEALELPLELCRTVATACPGDLRKGLQVAQLLSVPQLCV